MIKARKEESGPTFSNQSNNASLLHFTTIGFSSFEHCSNCIRPGGDQPILAAKTPKATKVLIVIRYLIQARDCVEQTATYSNTISGYKMYFPSVVTNQFFYL
jgi:hypothetical protein